MQNQAQAQASKTQILTNAQVTQIRDEALTSRSFERVMQIYHELLNSSELSVDAIEDEATMANFRLHASAIDDVERCFRAFGEPK